VKQHDSRKNSKTNLLLAGTLLGLSLLWLSLLALQMPALSWTTYPAQPLGLRIESNSPKSLKWNANTEEDLAGYKVYWGSPGQDTTMVDVGNVTEKILADLGAPEDRGKIFFVTAYDTSGNESLPSRFVQDSPDCWCDLNRDGSCDMQDWLLFGEDWGRTDCEW
jgi:hypothetical protein